MDGDFYSLKNELKPFQQGISVVKARKILGKSAKDLSDDQIQLIIDSLRLLAKESFSYNGSKRKANSNE